MAKDLGLAVAAGLVSALLFLSVLAGVAAGLLLTYVAPLPVLLAGLTLGLPGGLIAALTAVLAVGAVDGAPTLAMYGVTVALPAALVVRQALLRRTDAAGTVEWYPPGLVLSWLAGLALVVVAGALVLLPAHADGAEGVVREFLGGLLPEMLGPEAPSEQLPQLVTAMAAVLPSAMAAGWLVMMVVNAAVAQSLATRLGRAQRPNPAYRALALPAWLGPVLVAGALASLLVSGTGGYLGRNAAMILVIPYLLLGLAGIHEWLRGRPHGGLLLGVVYSVLLVFGWTALVVAGYGMVRHWVMLRRPRAGGSREEEK